MLPWVMTHMICRWLIWVMTHMSHVSYESCLVMYNCPPFIMSHDSQSTQRAHHMSHDSCDFESWLTWWWVTISWVMTHMTQPQSTQHDSTTEHPTWLNHRAPNMLDRWVMTHMSHDSYDEIWCWVMIHIFMSHASTCAWIFNIFSFALSLSHTHTILMYLSLCLSLSLSLAHTHHPPSNTNNNQIRRWGDNQSDRCHEQ